MTSVLQLLQWNDYASVVVITAVVYDYFLTFSKEVDYVWSRSWTRVSTVFVLVRYIGVSWAIGHYLFTWAYKGTTIYFVAIWELPVFIVATDLMMILRVYAMWSQSKRMLHILLSVYVLQVIIYFVFTGIYNDLNTNLSVTIIQVGSFPLCNISFTKAPSLSATYLNISAIPRCILSGILFSLAVVKTFKESIETYKATKQWQPNKYMQQLVTDGILYFLVNMLTNVLTTLQTSGPMINTATTLFVTMVAPMSLAPMTPRFIISIRELDDRRRHVHQSGIDSGFGIASQPVAERTVASAVAFADVDLERAEDQGAEGRTDGLEDIQLEAREGQV